MKKNTKLNLTSISKQTFRRMNFKDAHKTPVIEVDRRQGWVKFGNDSDWPNQFPQYLIELFNRSPIHSGIISTKQLYMSGLGFTKDNFKPNKDETLNEFGSKLIWDYEVFDGFYVEMIPNKLYTKFVEMRHIPFQKIRSNYTNKRFYFCDNWANVTRKEDTVQLERFIPGTKQIIEKGKRYLFYFRTWRPGALVYPLPNYMGALAHIETDAEIGNFNLNEIKNNFQGGKLISIYGGIPTEEAKRAFMAQFAEDYSGTDEAGRFIFLWSDSRDRNVDVQPLQGDNLDKRYVEVSERVDQKILSTHKIVSPLLIGIKTSGQLGGVTELISAYELFKNTYIDPRRLPFLNALQSLCAELGYTEKLEIIEVKPAQDLQPVQPSQPQQPGNPKPPQQPQQPQEPPAPKPPAPPVQQRSQFKDDHKKLISLFSKYGMSRNEVEVLETNYTWIENLGGSVNNKTAALSEKVALMEFATKLSDLDAAVLDYLSKDSLQPLTSIAAALDATVEDVQQSVTNLIDKGYIKPEDSGYALTTTGTKAHTKNLPDTYDTFIVYHYDVAPGLGDLIIPTTREFCKDLIDLNKVYTRQDIESISQEYGYSVWELRGGYYHNPNTDETTPYCRHIWTQEIVTKKAN